MGSNLKMRIAIYIRTIKKARGTERVVANIALGMAGLGHTVDFLVEVPKGSLLETLENQRNINVICLRDRNVPVLFHRVFQLLIITVNSLSRFFGRSAAEDGCSVSLLRVMTRENPSLLALYRYIRRERPVSVMSFLNYQNLALLLVAPFVKEETRIVVNVRNHITTSASHGQSEWMRSVPCMMKRFFNRADLVVAPSHGVVQDAMSITGISPERFRVIHNPVYRPELTRMSNEDPAHPWLTDSGIPVVMAAGKFKPQKDFSTLLRAFAIVSSRRVARLIILGSGPLQDDLAALSRQLGVHEHVRFPGHVGNPYAFFRRASVFVLSSAWEGLPNVLIEAMACGCPAVSTDCPSGPAEILDGGRYGKLVPVGDAQCMAEAILATLDAPPAPQAMIERAMNFSFEKAITDYESILCHPFTDNISPGGAA